MTSTTRDFVLMLITPPLFATWPSAQIPTAISGLPELSVTFTEMLSVLPLFPRLIVLCVADDDVTYPARRPTFPLPQSGPSVISIDRFLPEIQS